MSGHHPLSIQVRVHHLNENENLEHTLFSIKKGSVIQFKLGSTLFGQSIKLFINYPENPTDGFKRLVYRELKWRSDSLNKGDDTALHCDVTFELAGSFHYFFIPEGGDVLKPSGSGYILVDPVLTYGPENDILPLDSILCITYLAKCLGSFEKWEERLRTAKEVGYNMIHITPVQQLGGSDSAYSLRNQLKLNPLFDSPGKKCTISDISNLVEKMRKEWKVITITDVVLNHTANESEWLLKHPESTYNLVNSPHLRPAYLLDRSLWYFSLDIAAGKWANSGIPPAVNNEDQLNAIRETLKGYNKHQLKLHEFFLLHVDNILKEFAQLAQAPDRKMTRHTGELRIIPDPEYRRLKSSIDMQLALSIYAPTKLNTSNEVNGASEALRRKLEELNNAKMAEVESHFHSAVENVISAVRYERLSPDGPHLKSVSSDHPLVPQYFKTYGVDQNLVEDEKLMFSPQSCYIMAHNGWVMGDNPLKNFAEPGSNVYLRRELVAWGDSVKLRYGEKPEDSPFLWQFMTEYIQQLSRTFYGLRLDNCHSTPIHVAEYLIDKAREVRPDLFVEAELFTSSEAVDNIFVNRLGITALIRDVVLNHTANESEWLLKHPESTYNLVNSPHLRPAYLLDRSLWYFSLDIAAGKWANSGIPPAVNNEDQLNAIRETLKGYNKHQLKLHEFFLLHVDNILKEFAQLAQAPDRKMTRHTGELRIIPDPEYRRLKSSIDMQLALSIYAPTKLNTSNEVNGASEALRRKLEELNNAKMAEVESHFHSAVENVISAVRYERLSPDGPHLKSVSSDHPLVPQYFKTYGVDQNLVEDEKLMFSPQSCYIMAHNGWVMGDNPLKNFAEPGSNVYLRRELVAWGDSVKLRYGEKPEDSPFLWQFMTEYIQQLSRTFYGLRLDNCHSTPIHVAEYLIDKAREVRPDLFVEAELFTSSEAVDNIFVNRLGITALIRESMQAPDSHEQGRLVYRYGGQTVGAFMHPVTQPLTKCIAHAVFMDITHDNQCPMQIRSVYDYFPTAAMVSMACCATGSTWGYDQLVPHHIHVVSEKRLCTSWTDDKVPKRGYINAGSGIIAGKRALNQLHFELGVSGFSQVFVDQRDENTVAITRHCPATHQSVIMIARTAFRVPAKPKESSYVRPLRLQGTIEEIILEGGLEPVDHSGTTLGPNVYIDDTYINGLTDFKLNLREHIQIYESEMIESAGLSDDGYNEIDFIHFPPGSVIVLRVSLDAESRAAILRIRTCVSQFGYRMRSYSGNILKRGTHDFESILSHLTLADLNRVLFKCDAEERDDGKGRGTYNLPGYGNLVYCGLQGVMSELMNIRLEDDLGHPLCDNLRQGNWLPDYIASRLIDYQSTEDLGKWFEVVFESLRKLPRYLIPCYFDTIITGAYSSLLSAMWRKMSDFVSEGSTFVKALTMGSVILSGIIRSAPLPRLSPNLDEPRPPDENVAGQIFQNCITISAGLPHFSTGYMRNWGRDTFISLKGLLLVTGRHEDARYIILAFGACLRHGLIPNLLDRGVCARFNCRDAIWWWLQSVQDYCTIVPNGHKILKDKVSRLYPTDDSPALKPGACDQPLHDVIHEALQKHFQGLKFRERNAGRQIDEQMCDPGFNNEIGVDLDTGFVFGGNEFNCGTWMDKMGSSEKAGNKGKPATPRDGSAVEIVGLSKSALRWLCSMFERGHYPYCMVERTVIDESTSVGKTTIMTYKDWNDLIQANFENNFYVSPEKKPDDSKLINKRGMYKDTFKASQNWADFQLRPNFPIAMCVAPELFDPHNAWLALRTAEQHLLGPLGMRTLDPSDWNYDGNYVNSDDSTNMKTAKGWNYHQGPEWLWPVGYFLRAKLIFSKMIGGKQEFDKTLAFTKHVMSRHFLEIQKSKWRGLPELTNKDGAYCSDSCVVQAWSHATLLEVLFEMDALCSNENSSD